MAEDDKSSIIWDSVRRKRDRKKAFEHFNAIQPGAEYYSNARIHIAYLLEEEEKHDQAIEVWRSHRVGSKKSGALPDARSVLENKKDMGSLGVWIKASTDQKNVELISGKASCSTRWGRNPGARSDETILDLDPTTRMPLITSVTLTRSKGSDWRSNEPDREGLKIKRTRLYY